MNRQRELLTDEKLVRCVRWPRDLSAKEILAKLLLVERFIDFDNTLVVYHQSKLPILRDPFCGKPLAEFLAEKPFAIQTWHGGILPEALFDLDERRALTTGDLEHYASIFKTRNLPQPALIFTPPVRIIKVSRDTIPHRDDVDGRRLCKDFQTLDLREGAEIYDDEPNHLCAPGFKIISSF